MKLEIHIEARKNYNNKADALVMQLRPVPDHLKREDGSHNPNIHTAHTFSHQNIIGEMEYGWTNFTGSVVAKAFSEGGQLIGLFDEDYAGLVQIAEGVQKSITPRGLVSSLRLTDLIFDWIKKKRRGEASLTMTEQVLAECEKLIKELEIWMPISHLYIQGPFDFGKITFRAVTKQMMDDWETFLLSAVTKPEEIESTRKGIERRRAKYQGLATATIKVEAEPKRAYEIAFEEIDKTVSLLRLMSPANFHPMKTCYSAPIGRQHEDAYTYLLIKEGKISGSSEGLVDRSGAQWSLKNEDLQTWLPELRVLHMLLTREKLTDFQSSLLSALILYSRSSLAKQVSDKLVYILVALESAYLKDSSELIQDAISLRMAYMQDVSVEQRKAIISNVKAVYKLRSSFIHHGQDISLDETKALAEFMTNALLSLLALIPIAATEMTREEFFNNLENRKLSG